ATVNWSAQGGRGVVLEDATTAVATGSLIRVGYFDITDAQIAVNANDVSFLDSHFFEFGSGFVGDGTDADGTFAEVSDNFGLNFPDQAIHVWVLNTPTIGTATQQGIYDATSNVAWSFPQPGPISVTGVDLADSGVTPVIGLLGGPVTIPGNPFSPFDSTAVLAPISGVPSPTNDVLQYAMLKGQPFTQTRT